jgi:hypothetical protein
MNTASAPLECLPDELLLEILLHLSTIRSFETQSTAFAQKEKEKARQRENRIRQLALHSLCLTSRHLSRLTTPVLYASFTGSATWHGIKSLQLFLKTITQPKGLSGNKPTYARYLQYVENRLADYLGNDLYAAIENSNALFMVADYFALLAKIINLAPNLQHLSVVSLETGDVSFWRYILREQNTEFPCFTMATEHGLSSLKTVCVQTNIDDHGEAKEASFLSICSAMASLPSLSDFRATGVMVNELVGPKANIGLFRKLQRIEITECIIGIQIVSDILSKCEGLRHIVCQWAYLDCVGETLLNLRPGLLCHSNTLETLCLDFREVRSEFDYRPPQCIGPLQQFERLNTLTISKTGFFDEDGHGADHLDPLSRCQLAELLPLGLKRLNLLIEVCDIEPGPETLDDSDELWALSEACKSSILNLSEVTVTGNGDLYGALRLIQAFEEAGVLFEVITER